jgi:hypothetical protein
MGPGPYGCEADPASPAAPGDVEGEGVLPLGSGVAVDDGDSEGLGEVDGLELDDGEDVDGALDSPPVGVGVALCAGSGTVVAASPRPGVNVVPEPDSPRTVAETGWPVSSSKPTTAEMTMTKIPADARTRGRHGRRSCQVRGSLTPGPVGRSITWVCCVLG